MNEMQVIFLPETVNLKVILGPRVVTQKPIV